MFLVKFYDCDNSIEYLLNHDILSFIIFMIGCLSIIICIALLEISFLNWIDEINESKNYYLKLKNRKEKN